MIQIKDGPLENTRKYLDSPAERNDQYESEEAARCECECE